MHVLRAIIITVLLVLFQSSTAQGDRGITNGLTPLNKKCMDCLEAIANKPPEVQFGLSADDQGDVYFIVNDELWFNEFFKKGTDGIGVDVVEKGQFACGAENSLPISEVRQGKVLNPVYFKDFKNQIIHDQGFVYVKVGHLTNSMLATEYELNLMLVKGNMLCYYQHFYNLETKRWKLLDTGLFMDTIAGMTQTSDIRDLTKETNILLSKRMKFEIPFDKGKAEYSSEDIQPLYDSLRLTDYHILKAEVLAYSSVEGTKERNIELQQKRANSIVKALNSYQEREITAEIKCAENWVEFINDMTSIGRKDLASMTQSEIKKELKDPALSADLESVLKDHRKAILVLDLQKKSKYKEMTSLAVLSLYEQSLLDKNIQTALEIQQELFARVEDLDLSPTVLKSVAIPKQVEYGALLNNQSVFDYDMDPSNVLESLLAFRELEYILPDDAQISFNICVLETRAWLIGQSTIKPGELLKSINHLRVM